MGLLTELPPRLVVVAEVHQRSTRRHEIEPFLHFVGIHPWVMIEPHPIPGVRIAKGKIPSAAGVDLSVFVVRQGTGSR